MAKLAADYVQETCVESDNRAVPTVWFWQGMFWRWAAGRYISTDWKTMYRRVLRWAIRHKAGANTRLVEDLLQVIAARQEITGGDSLPFWLDLDRLPPTTCLMPPEPMRPYPLGDLDFIATADHLIKPAALARGNTCYDQGLTPAWFSTVKLPYRYDSDAECPQWEAWLAARLEGDTSRIHLLQEWCGYLLTPSTARQAVLVLYGDGKTGKTTCSYVLEQLVGSENVSAVPLTAFGNRFGLAETLGKSLNLSDEISRLTPLMERNLKWYVSGSPFQFEKKFVDPKSTRPTARLVVSLNTWPEISDPSGAFYRRLLVIPFRRIIQEQPDLEIFNKLLGEIAGIFNWSLAGLERLNRQGAFTKSQLGEDVKNNVASANQPHREFIRDCIRTDPASWVSHHSLLRSYTTWCSLQGYPADRSVHQLGQRVREQFHLGKSTCKTLGGVSRRGIAGVTVSLAGEPE